MLGASGTTRGLTVGLNYFLGRSTSVNTAFAREGSQTTGRFAIAKSLPVNGTGLGYRIQSSPGNSDLSSGTIQYQGPYGRYEAEYARVGGKNLLSVNVAGGVVAIGGEFIATRSVEQSFGLIRVPETEGVRVYSENQLVGKTNAKGDIVVPSLLAYYGNRLSIDPDGIPLNFEIAATDKVVAPSFRSGAVVQFPVHRLQSITGTLLVESASGTVVPAFGELSVAGDVNEVVSPIGKEGQFYLQDLGVGLHRAKLQYQGGNCEFQLTVMPTRQPFVNVGTIRCTLQK
jgi:outer membrane usher protein